MSNLLLIVGWILGAYLIGSINFGIISSKLMKLPDPRHYGSHNPGATNVLRSGSKVAAIATLIGDFVKGFIPLFTLKQANLHISNLGILLALVALATLLGHLYPIFFNFKGGKGVATAAGISLAIHWLFALILVVIWGFSFLISKRSSVASIITAIATPISYFLGAGHFAKFHAALMFALAIIAACIVYRHSSNIQRLLAGKEDKIVPNKNRHKSGH